MRNRSAVVVAILVAVAPCVQSQTRTVNADAIPPLRITAEARIGHEDDPQRSFNQIRFVEADRDGNIYVYDTQSISIRVFSKTGVYLRTIGRRGRGPGEFSQGNAISEFGMVGDSIWSFDVLGRRLNVFRLDGSVVRTTTIPLVDVAIPIHHGAVGFIAPGFMRRDGGLTSKFEPFAPNGDFEVRALRGRGLTNTVRITDTVRVPNLLFAPRAQKLDTIGWIPFPPDEVAHRQPMSTRGADGRLLYGNVKVIDGVNYTVPDPPNTRRYFYTSLSEGSAVVDRIPSADARPSTFELVRFGLAGKIAHRIRFTYTPRRYDGRILDSLAMRAVTRQGPPSAAAFRAVRAAMAFPEFQAPIFNVWAANDGALWLRREWDGGAHQRWIVVDRTGRVRGTVALPSNARPRWARDNSVIAEEPDADSGVPWLVRYRIQAGL